VLRFLIEILRDDIERGEYGPYIAQYLLIPGALLVLAAAYAYGPARSIANVTFRRLTQVLAVVPALALYFLLKPASFAATTPIQLSTSQWIAVLTGVAAAVVWGTLLDSARNNPEAAMSLGEGALLSDEDEAGDAMVADGDDEEAPAVEAASAKKKKKKKKGKRKEQQERRAAPTADDESAAPEPPEADAEDEPEARDEPAASEAEADADDEDDEDGELAPKPA
jgi:phosphatidylglycerol:prolipoprotein diacylglycerol transferase